MPNETMSQTPFITPPPSYYSEIPGQPKKSLTKVIFSIIFGIIVIILLGTGIALATRIWDPLWNPFRPAPEKVIEKMSQKMNEVKTIHYEGKIDFETKKEDEKESFKMAMDFRNDSDKTDSKNLKTTGDFNLTITFTGMQISLAGETITIGDTSYIKFTTIPTLPFLGMANIDLSRIKDQWIKYEEETTSEIKEKQEEIRNKIEALFKDKKIFVVKKEFPDEKIRNLKTYHYLVALNKEEIKKILPELFKIMKDFLGPEELLNLGKIEESLSKIEEFFEKIGEITGEVWIGKKDNYLYKIKGEKEINMSQFEKTAKGAIMIKVDMDFSNFDQPVKIEAPKEYKNFNEIFAPSFGSALIETQQKAKDARIIADMTQMQTIAEIYFDIQKPRSYTNLCASKDIINLKNDILSQGGTNYSCNVQTGSGAGKSYCIEVKLNSGNWYCIDSNFVAKKYSNNPACATCMGKSCKCE